MKRFLHKLYVGFLSLTGKAIDIVSGAKYPAGELSNFAPHEFTFRGIRFHCMEGLLQGLKFQDTDEQNKVFGLTGKEAKSAGKTFYHTIGKTDPSDTVLTEKELCDILTKIREEVTK